MGTKRYFVVFGTFLLALLLYIDRVCISVAKDPIAESLNLTDKEMGWVLSIFALGYALFQTPSGILADKYGPRRILTTIVSIWSVFTALTGAAFNFITLLIARFLFGAGEAGAFPSMSKAVFNWIPLKERGLVTGINFSGSRIGAAFALPVVAWMVEELGWRTSFFLLGLVGFIWAIAWYVLFRDKPEEHPVLNEAEKTFIVNNRQQKATEDDEKTRLSAIGKSKNVWLAMGQYFASNFTFFFALTWLFPHIKNEYQLDTIEAGFYSSLPLIAGALGNWFSGWLIDVIYRKGNWNLSRILPAIIGFTLAAAGLIASIYMTDALGAVIFLSVAIFGADMTLPPSWSFCVDTGKQHTGAISGTMNMAGNLGSFITALLFPYVQLWMNSTKPYFIIAAVLNGLAILIWLAMKPNQYFEDY